jgi:hypothetical protein
MMTFYDEFVVVEEVLADNDYYYYYYYYYANVDADDEYVVAVVS